MVRSLSLVLVLSLVSRCDSQDSVLSIFLDRVEVGLCRARCSHTYRGEAESESQCWTVCHLLAADPPTWARVCGEAGHVCTAACLAACRHFSSLLGASLEDDLSPGYSVNNCSLSLPRPLEATVFLVVGQDDNGDWYEVTQTRDTSVELVPYLTNVFVVRIPHTGNLAVTQVSSCQVEDDSQPWQPRLESVLSRDGIFEVRVEWTAPLTGTCAVSWAVGPVTGVLHTNLTWAQLPVPPLSTALIEVTVLATGDKSDTLTVHTPDIREEEEEEEEEVEVEEKFHGVAVTLAVAGATGASLFTILIIITYLHRQKPATTSHQERDRSLISFETFVKENRISIVDLHSPRHIV